MDCSDKLTLVDHENPKVLLKLITTWACELAHKIGMKLISDLTKWDELQHFDIFSMVWAYYQLFANQTFLNLIKWMISDPAKEVMMKLHILNLKVNILDDGEYFREIFNAA